jgi:ribonucleotide monophosphatase NagD (HAD superfamily)
MIPEVTPKPTSIMELLATYEGFLIDAYGVLVDAVAALPGAAWLIAELERRGMPYAVVTNDASRSQATCARRFAGLGLPITAHRVITSGSLLPGFFRDHGLAGARTAVLGTEDSYDYVIAGGGVPVPLAPGMQIDALAVCDDAGTPFLDGIELALSAVVRAIDAGRTPALVLPNPDLIYPKGEGELGLTAGSMALVIEAALARRFADRAPTFTRLGKPEPHLFVAARHLVGRERLVMIGDQLETDIAGARAAGIDSALLAGISRWDGSTTITPTYLLSTLDSGLELGR